MSFSLLLGRSGSPESIRFVAAQLTKLPLILLEALHVGYAGHAGPFTGLLPQRVSFFKGKHRRQHSPGGDVRKVMKTAPREYLFS